MPRKQAVDDAIYLDEAEGFLLEHALFSPPRTWPPLPVETLSQSDRIAITRRKMDWEAEALAHPDEPIELPLRKEVAGDEDANKERCVICLMALRDRTIVGVCGHEFCFECIGVWANQSRRCPLCSADMAPFLLHDLDASVPTKFYLPPLPQRKVPLMSLPGPSRRLSMPERQGERMKEEPDELDIQVERRREIYHHELYAKHIATNSITGFTANPSPRHITNSPALIARATTFLRRELRVWTQIDVEFLTTYIISLIKAVDIRSEPAIRLIAEFLDAPSGPGYPRGAEHFAHELYSFLRSPYKELRKWDEVAQYDPIPSPRDRSPSPSRSASPISPRSLSRSPSPYSRSPSPRDRSRSRRSLSPRDPRKRDTYLPRRSSIPRRWDEADTWLDPDYADWLDEKRRVREERFTRKRRRISPHDVPSNGESKPMRSWGKQIELLPSPPPAPLRMDDDAVQEDEQDKDHSKKDDEAGLHILGAAKVDVPVNGKREALLAKLAKAKAESALLHNEPPLNPTPTLSEPPIKSEPAMSSPAVRAVVKFRLKLRLKLAQEKKSYIESRALSLRLQILEARAKRETEETDAVLRRMDVGDRDREIRRRLMVEKMKSAETESERRARELKERLLGEKKLRLLKEKLKGRKRVDIVV